MRDLIKKLHLNNVGFLELLTAMYPTLHGYGFGSFLDFTILVPIIIMVLALQRKPKVMVKPYKPLMVLFIYVMGHNIIWLFVMGNVPSYFLNTWILYIISFMTIFIVAPRLDLDKFIGSLNWVAIVCLIGMYYQGVIMIGGGGVTRLMIPFLPTNGVAPTEKLRPMSFFGEPNAYVTFMMIPLLLSLRNKAYVWSVLIIISLFFSTSTTGIVTSFIIVAFHGASMRKGKSRIIVGLLLVAMYLLLTQTSLFEFGLDKLNNSDVTTDSRTANGPTFVFAMPWNHLFLGAPYANAADYYMSGELGFLDIDYNQNIYMATLWQMIALYGIVGALFLLWYYWKLYKDCKTSRPYIICLIVELVTASFFLGPSFCIQMVSILCLLYNIDMKDSSSTSRLISART